MAEPKRHTLDRIVVQDVRIVKRAELEPSPRVNVIAGNNGQGKTTLLEAVYLLATSRSFRTGKLAQLIRHGCRVASVRGTLTEGQDASAWRREQSIGLEGGRRTVRLDGEPPPSLSHYATRSPVVVFDPHQMTLSTGPASDRRTLLDRVTLFTDPSLASHRRRYTRALRERQQLVQTRFPQLDDNPELDAYESLLADHGAAITRAREAASAALREAMAEAFAHIAAPELDLAVAYDPGGTTDPAVARQRYHEQRRRDAQSKRTRFGPHRDDLAFRIDGHPARSVASQGQHRAITLALKLAELSCIGRARGVLPILLLDDVSSELDADRTTALFAHLARTESQIFLTTTRRDLIVTTGDDGADRRDFEVVGGKLQPIEN